MKTLESIESYIQERPDSALTALRAIDTNSLTTQALRARYSLLFATALDKNYIDTTDQSVIMPAIEFYDKTDDAVHKMRAWYYLGRIQQNAGNNEEALQSFLQALDVSKKTADYVYKGMINSIIAGLYSSQYNSKTALLFMTEAYKCFMRSSDSLSQWKHQGTLAVFYGNNRERTKADSIFQVFLNKPVLDSAFFARKLFIYAKLLVGRKPLEPERSIEYFNLAKGTFHGKPTVEDYYVKAYALTLSGRNAEADGLLKALEPYGKNAAASYFKYKIYRTREQKAEALPYFEQSVQYQDSVIISNLNHSLEKARNKYAEEKLGRVAAARREDNAKSVIIVLLLSLAVLLILSILYYSKQKWTNRLERINQLKEEAEKQCRFMDEALSENESEVKRYRQKYIAAFKNQYLMLNNMCASYLSPSSKEPKDKVYNELKDILSEFTDNTKEISKAEDIVNKEHDNIIETIRNEFPAFSEKDYKIIALFIMGFEAKTISLLTNYTTKTVYGKKDRIKKKISSSNSIHKETIINLIG